MRLKEITMLSKKANIHQWTDEEIQGIIDLMNLSYNSAIEESLTQFNKELSFLILEEPSYIEAGIQSLKRSC